MPKTTKPLLKDSEFREFFETNYDDSTAGRNVLSLAQVLELSEGCTQEVYLKCPKHNDKESVQRPIQHWCVTFRSTLYMQ